MRKAALTIALIIPLVYAATVVSIPNFSGLAVRPYVILILMAALALGWPYFQRPHVSFLAVIPALLALIPAVVIARSFGRIDMVAIWFHADFGTAGATLTGLRSQILWAFAVSGIIGLSLAVLTGIWNVRTKGMIVLTVALIGLNPFVRAIIYLFAAPSVQSDLNARFTVPDIRPAVTTQPDIVIIYLEGTDRQYADEAVWGKLYDPMRELEAEGLTFTRVGQMTGTNWSLAGMVASQCGVPVVPLGLLYKFNYDGLEAFMPGMTCLGDVATELGYDTSYVVGGELAFGGIGNFYKSHGFATRIGAVELRAAYPPEVMDAAFASWVLDDEIVFDAAKSEFDRLIKPEDPFLLVLETIGPHDMKGVLSRKCNDGKTAALSDDVSKVVDCLLRDTLAFVRNTQDAHAAAGRSRELRFVILSDHLSHSTGMLPDVAAEYAGSNTAIFIGGPVERGQQISKPGAMIDVYPTMLEWLGFADAPVSAGLGVSLLGSAPTLVERHGIADLDKMIVADVPLLNVIWAPEP